MLCVKQASATGRPPSFRHLGPSLPSPLHASISVPVSYQSPACLQHCHSCAWPFDSLSQAAQLRLAYAATLTRLLDRRVPGHHGPSYATMGLGRCHGRFCAVVMTIAVLAVHPIAQSVLTALGDRQHDHVKLVHLLLLEPTRLQSLPLPLGECLPGARPARYFSINYPDFSPRFTLPWRSPPSRPHCTAHLPYKARCKIKQDL